MTQEKPKPQQSPYSPVLTTPRVIHTRPTLMQRIAA